MRKKSSQRRWRYVLLLSPIYSFFTNAIPPQEWKRKNLKKFDEKESFRIKKMKKHGSRDEFVAYLENKVKSDVDAVTLHFSEKEEEEEESSPDGKKTTNTTTSQ